MKVIGSAMICRIGFKKVLRTPIRKATTIASVKDWILIPSTKLGRKKMRMPNKTNLTMYFTIGYREFIFDDV